MKKKLIVLVVSFILLTLSLANSPMVFAGTCNTDSDCTIGEYCDHNPDNNNTYGTCVDPNAGSARQGNNLQETTDVNVDLSEYLTLRDGQKVSEVFAKPSDLVNLIVRVVFTGAGIFLFAMIIISGLSMIAGAEGKTLDKAKTTMTNALIGFGIMFAAYWILQVIALITGAQLGF